MPHAPVLQRRIDRGRHSARSPSPASPHRRDAPPEQPPRRNRHRSQLRNSIDHVANPVYVFNVALLRLADNLPAVLRKQDDAGVLKSQRRGVGRAPNRADHRIKDVARAVREGYQQPRILGAHDFGRNHPLHYFHAVGNEAPLQPIATFRVKSAQEAGPRINRRVETERRQKSAALQRHVAAADATGLPRRPLQREQVVRGDGQLGARTFERRRARFRPPPRTAPP